jgi:hypothetical protein
MKCYAQYKGSVGVEAHGAFSYGRIKSHKKRETRRVGFVTFTMGIFLKPLEKKGNMRYNDILVDFVT